MGWCSAEDVKDSLSALADVLSNLSVGADELVANPR
jgi:hypothetical protein